MVRKTELKVDLSHFSSFNIMSCLIYTDLISSLLDPTIVNPGLSLIYIGAYVPKSYEYNLYSLKLLNE